MHIGFGGTHVGTMIHQGRRYDLGQALRQRQGIQGKFRCATVGRCVAAQHGQQVAILRQLLAQAGQSLPSLGQGAFLRRYVHRRGVAEACLVAKDRQRFLAVGDHGRGRLDLRLQRRLGDRGADDVGGDAEFRRLELVALSVGLRGE